MKTSSTYAQIVSRLREKTGFGLSACNEALSKCDNDEILAEAWLRYAGCAICVKPRPGETYLSAHERWVMEMARKSLKGTYEIT